MAAPVSLSPRQAQVARLLDSGKTQEQVAALLGITRRTVWHHTAEIRKRTGTRTTAAALSRVRARRATHDSRSGDL